ncbi:MAG TPA: hypothetical protein VHU23_12365 [Rhizomicrobium sp.]|jgi:hypothetical protein|nr:hypothetical protein [Rhizomicrobium sp.]
MSAPLFSVDSLYLWADKTYQRTPHFAGLFKLGLARELKRLEAENRS